MNEFFEKHFRFIVLILLALILGGGGMFQIVDKVFPDVSNITKEVMRELMIEVVQDEIAPIKSDIKQIKEQNQVFADDIAEDWVRVMKKQYLKVQTGREDLSWDDVEYALSKWPVLPDNWITPELTAMIEYLEVKYEEHIVNGG